MNTPNADRLELHGVTEVLESLYRAGVAGGKTDVTAGQRLAELRRDGWQRPRGRRRLPPEFAGRLPQLPAYNPEAARRRRDPAYDLACRQLAAESPVRPAQAVIEERAAQIRRDLHDTRPRGLIGAAPAAAPTTTPPATGPGATARKGLISPKEALRHAKRR